MINHGLRKKYIVRTERKGGPLDKAEYVGMNHYAAKAFGFRAVPAKNEVVVVNGLSKNLRDRTIVHEIVEAEGMKNGGKYWPNHEKAIKAEGVVKL